MIPKEWRDYTWQVRPWVVLAWLAVSPAIVLVLLWAYSTEGVDWPAWVQAVGSVLGIGIAIAAPRQQRKNDEKRRLADAAAQNYLSALKLFRNINDAHAFAQQTHRQMVAGLASDGFEAPMFERYLAAVTTSFNEETSAERAMIASHVRGVLNVVVFSLTDIHATNRPAKIGEAVGYLQGYKTDAKAALDSAASAEGLSVADV